MTRPLPVIGDQFPDAAAPDAGSSPRRERADAQKNRARILEAARKLMKKRALDELCMDELAEMAGVGKGTLYRRFADKQALIHALLDDDERILQDDVKRAFPAASADPRGAALALLDKLFAFVVDHAEVLAAAEASARNQGRFSCAPYAWRHAVIVHHLERASIARAGGAAHVADMLLATMAGEVVVRAMARAGASKAANAPPESIAAAAEEVKSQARVFFRTVLYAGSNAATGGSR